MMNNILDYLKNKRLLWQANSHTPLLSPQASGYVEFDQHLQGGLPEHGMVEIESMTGIGELRLLLPHLSNKQQQDQRLLVFISLPMQLNAEFLAQQGINLSQVLIVAPNNAKQALWAAEQCLKSGCCSNVLLWHSQLEVHQVKRLQLAAQQGNALQFVLKPMSQITHSLPLSLSLQLQTHPQGIHINIRKRKGGGPIPAFTINMQQHWPDLVIPVQPNNVLPFPHRRVN